jgi:hypothetical protein
LISIGRGAASASAPLNRVQRGESTGLNAPFINNPATINTNHFLAFMGHLGYPMVEALHLNSDYPIKPD